MGALWAGAPLCFLISSCKFMHYVHITLALAYRFIELPFIEPSSYVSVCNNVCNIVRLGMGLQTKPP